MKNQSVKCKNCGNKSKGKYCISCGQRTDTKRLNAIEIITEFWKLFTNVEHSFVKTLVGMYRTPGRVMGEYLGGRRKRYQNPITYFAVGILLYSILGSHAKENGYYVGTLLEYNQYYLYAILIVVTIIGYAFAGYPKHHFVEVLVILAYVYGTVLLTINPALLYIQLPLLFLRDRMDSRLFTIIWDIPVILYVIYAFRSFFIFQKMSQTRLALTVSAAIAVYLVFMFFFVKAA
ncbi:MAG: hypothetical protein BGO69_10660 [Bacteroidetes bacterium 46-16]|nr:MAG: hypothetical protein BGO69_10660 [Bacteroidetes bacterium 46-16]